VSAYRLIALTGAASWFLLVRRVEPIAGSAIEPKIATAAGS
jgi:hypothetical protein